MPFKLTPAEIVQLLDTLRCPDCGQYAEYHGMDDTYYCSVSSEEIRHQFNMLEIMNEVK